MGSRNKFAGDFNGLILGLLLFDDLTTDTAWGIVRLIFI
jgi:hypothetical protein